MTTRETIEGWFDQGKTLGNAYMAVYWDSFDGPHGDYPVYFPDKEKAQEGINARKGDQLMEVYDLNADKEAQMKMRRSWALRPV